MSKPSTAFTLQTALLAVVGGAGVMALLVAVGSFQDRPKWQERHDFVANLPELGSTAPDQWGVLEGRVAMDTPALRGEFVAYIREVYASRNARTSSWRFLDGRVQPFAVNASDRTFQVVNNDYTFDREIRDWTEFSRDESAPTFTTGAIRIEGLVAGGPVMIVGRSNSALEARRIVAATIAGVDRATYLRHLSEKIARGGETIRIMLLASCVGLGLAVWLGWRLKRIW